MSSKVENKEVKTTTTKIYYDQSNMHGEMMRYRTNSLSYKLGLLALLFSICAAFICMNSVTWDATVTIKILGNILILLLGFLSVEKVKSYSSEYSFVMVGIGIVCIGRIVWLPLQLFIWYGKYLANGKEATSEIQQHLGQTILNPSTNSYLPADGYWRGTAAIILLVIAAVLFIGSGVIGLIKSKKYHEYMKTQDTTKGV